LTIWCDGNKVTVLLNVLGDNIMTQCSQCGKPAIEEYHTHPLCVEHLRMMLQISYFRQSWAAANLNSVRSDLNVNSPIQYPLVEIPPNPFVGGDILLNNISVSQSTIGALNTGTISNIDVAIGLIRDKGDNDLATMIKKLTEEVINNAELSKQEKNEINEQLEYLVAQALIEEKHRVMGPIKSIFLGIRNYVSPIASLLAIWNNLEPLIKIALGIT
jgi:hypothetical protein